MDKLATVFVSRGVAVAVLVILFMAASHARELAVDPADLVPVELATVGMDPATGTPVVLLREPASGDIVPIAIGVAEARAILLALQGVEVQRPQTHDLIGNLFEAVDARLERVIVDDLVQGTYMGVLELRVGEGETPVLVDSRPSDALALAARSDATILVAPRILVSAREREYEGLETDQVVTALGITVVEATGELRNALNLPDRGGVLVSGVRGPAARKGLEVGSLILEVNGETPESPMHFLDLVRETPSGEDAMIRYWQAGEEHGMELDTDVPEAIDPEEGIPL